MALSALWVSLLLAGAAPLQAEISPARLVSGSGQLAEMVVSLPEGLEPSSTQARPSAGVVEKLAPLPGQKLRLWYRVPKTKFPQVVLIGLFDPAREAPLAHLEVPLWGAGVLTAKTRPGAQVFLEVAERNFGPVTASPEGGVSVAFEAPPGVPSGVWIARDEAGETRRPAPLKVPPLRPLVVVASPTRLLADGQTQATVCALSAEGVPVALTVDAGALSEAAAQGAQTCGRFTSPSSRQWTRAVISARAIFAEGAAVEDSREIELELPPIPAPKVEAPPPPAPRVEPPAELGHARAFFGPSLLSFTQSGGQAGMPQVRFEGLTPAASVEAVGFAKGRFGGRLQLQASRFVLQGDTGSQRRSFSEQTLGLALGPAARWSLAQGGLLTWAGYAFQRRLGYRAQEGQLVSEALPAHLLQVGARLSWPLGPVRGQLGAAAELGLGGEVGADLFAGATFPLSRESELGLGYAFHLQRATRDLAQLGQSSHGLGLQLAYSLY